MSMRDVLIRDFTDPRFAQAFQLYFHELGAQIKDWDGLFREMNQGDNRAYVRLTGEGETVGFLQFTPIAFSSWFFEEKAGFIREFWVAPGFRGQGHGRALLALAEEWFREEGVSRVLLTSDTAPEFYLKMGYRPAAGCAAKNHDPVFVRDLN